MDNGIACLFPYRHHYNESDTHFEYTSASESVQKKGSSAYCQSNGLLIITIVTSSYNGLRVAKKLRCRTFQKWLTLYLFQKNYHDLICNDDYVLEFWCVRDRFIVHMAASIELVLVLSDSPSPENWNFFFLLSLYVQGKNGTDLSKYECEHHDWLMVWCSIHLRLGLDLKIDWWFTWTLKVGLWGCSRLQAANHWAASANQNITVDILHKKPRLWVPCFPHKPEHSDRVKDWWIPSQTFKLSTGAHSLVTRNTDAMKWSKIHSFDCWDQV